MEEKKKKLQSQADLGSQAYSPSQFLVCSMGWSRYKGLGSVWSLGTAKRVQLPQCLDG